MSIRASFFAIIAFTALQATAVLAQDSNAYPKLARDGFGLSRAAAEGLETSLQNNSDDLVARTKLLGFYARGASKLIGHDATIEARRRHILWLIEHHPESDVTGLSEATIDRAGHSLADPAGYEQAATLWMEQARQHQDSAPILSHAARFFQLSDKERAIMLLKQAHRAAPDTAEYRAHMGYVYALAILGVEMINSNGLPMSQNVAEAQGDFAKRAVVEVRDSSDAVVAGVAGKIVGEYGLMLAVMSLQAGKPTVDYVPLSEEFLAKAKALEPANPAWPAMLDQLRALRSNARQP
jgi:hypothetical protein